MEQEAGTDSRQAQLSRTAIIEAAILIADSHGLDALSMRSVGKQVGVEAMSLYHHVRNKDDILDGMVDVVFSQYYDPQPGQPWAEEMRKRHHSARAALKRHPWALGLMDSRRQPGPQTLEHHDAVIACLRNAGFSLVLTGHAFALLDAHLYGHMLQELSLPFQTEEELAAVADQIMTSLPPDYIPHFQEFTIKHALAPGYSFGNEFDYGLDLILAGLAQRFEQERLNPDSDLATT